ncbi:SOS response-associated peptidase [Ferrovibrio sp.]|uniref:SOS response-associated peptidase n=1 Tax=Ferrovibrio sp. TaxID=1917215 RepID=UPI0035AE5EE7
MCGRFVQKANLEVLVAMFGIDGGQRPNMPARYNIAPTQTALAVRFNPQTGRRQIDPLSFGLVPLWAKDKTRAAAMMNARGESLHEKPTFREAFAERRCLIPADAFYEWKGEGRGKQPYAVRPCAPDGLFAFAGIWDRWRDPVTREIHRSFAIVTTAANSLLAPLHERMPVILPAESWPLWLGEQPGDPQGLIRSYPADLMHAYPVNAAVGNVANDDAALLDEQRLLA